MGNCIWKVKPEDRLCRFCKYWYCEDRPNKAKRGDPKHPVYFELKNLPVGSWKFYPLDYSDRCRSAASKLKTYFGVVFSVNRIGDQIRVMRTL